MRPAVSARIKQIVGIPIKGGGENEFPEGSTSNRVLPGADERGILTSRKGGRLYQ
jgi:hypothetical protein